MNDFLNRIRHDRDIAARLAVAVGAKDGDAALEALVAFAALNGFDVTSEDVRTVQERLRSVGGREGDLGEAELESIAGGNVTVPLGWHAIPVGRHFIQ